MDRHLRKIIAINILVIACAWFLSVKADVLTSKPAASNSTRHSMIQDQPTNKRFSLVDSGRVVFSVKPELAGDVKDGTSTRVATAPKNRPVSAEAANRTQTSILDGETESPLILSEKPSVSGVNQVEYEPVRGSQVGEQSSKTARWQVKKQDETYRQVLQRWSVSAGWQLIWQVDRDISIEAEWGIDSEFKRATITLLESTQFTDLALKPCFHSNAVVRIVRTTTNCIA